MAGSVLVEHPVRVARRRRCRARRRRRAHDHRAPRQRAEVDADGEWFDASVSSLRLGGAGDWTRRGVSGRSMTQRSSPSWRATSASTSPASPVISLVCGTMAAGAARLLRPAGSPVSVVSVPVPSTAVTPVSASRAVCTCSVGLTSLTVNVFFPALGGHVDHLPQRAALVEAAGHDLLAERAGEHLLHPSTTASRSCSRRRSRSG